MGSRGAERSRGGPGGALAPLSPMPGREGAAPAEDAQRCPGSPAPSRLPPAAPGGLWGRGESTRAAGWSSGPALLPPGHGGCEAARVRRGRGGSPPVCEGGDRPGQGREVLCALGPGTDVADAASSVTALTLTHTSASHCRVEAEQRHAGRAGLRRKPRFGPGCHGCCLWPSCAGSSSDHIRWRLLVLPVQMPGARPKTY